MTIKRYAVYPARYEESNDGEFVKYEDAQHLQSQLTARDAALDAVLDFAMDEQHSMCDSPGETALRRQLVELLASHGVHPR